MHLHLEAPLLEAKDLSFSIEKGHPIFENVNFIVGGGDVVVLQGASGSG